MKAVADRFPIEQIVVEGLAAGLDHFIVRGPRERQVAAWEALVRAVEASPALLARLRESLIRIVGVQGDAAGGAAGARRSLAAAFPWPAHQGLAGSFAIAPSHGGQVPVDRPRRAASPVTIYCTGRRAPTCTRAADSAREDWPRQGQWWYALPASALSGGGSGVTECSTS